MAKFNKIGLSGMEIVLILISSAILYFILNPILHKESSEKISKRRQTCINNQQQISTAILMMAQDNNGKLPSTSMVWEGYQYSNTNMLTCPDAKELKNGYLYNNNFSNVKISKIFYPGKRIMTVDGKTNIEINRIHPNTYYTPADVQYRHYEREQNKYWAIASYLDGHVKMVTSIKEPKSWDKKPVKKLPAKKKTTKTVRGK